MAAVTSKPALSVLRELLSALRSSSSSKKLAENPTARYILAQYRRHQTTDEQLCKAREEMLYSARTYLCYLHSTRRCQALNAEYAGRGERSIEDTANLVGFKLPHDPKPSRSQPIETIEH